MMNLSFLKALPTRLARPLAALALLLALLLPWAARAQAPTLTGLTPGSGAQGSTFAVTGTNLTGTRSVLLGGQPAPFVVNSATRLTVTVPRGASTHKVQVTTPGGAALSSAAFGVSKLNSNNFSEVTVGLNRLYVGGSNSVPTFTDLDGDGLLDLVAGQLGGYLSHYEQSAANSLSFGLVTSRFNNIYVGSSNSSPAFTDLDGDGLLDLVVGRGDGTLNHYEQDAVNSAAFTQVTGSFPGIDVGNVSAPAFTDLDGDGLLDLVVGSSIGTLSHYEQSATNSTAFSPGTASFNNSTSAGNRARPAFIDLDGDGLLDLVVGEDQGNLRHYEQSAANSTNFNLVTTNFNAIDVGYRAAPAFTDLDGDGRLDLVVGEQDGTLYHYAQFLPVPTLTGLSPTSGPAGTPVTITGTDLDQIQGVRFGTGGLGLVLSRTAGSLVVRVPVDAASGPLTLTPATGSALVSATSFAYTPRPAGLVAVLAPAGPLDVCQPRTLTATAASPAFATGAGFTFAPGATLSSGVQALAVQTDGKVLVGGDFTFYQGVTTFRFLRLNADGSRDTGFANGLVGFNGDVNSVAVQADGKVLVGGEFSAYNGTAASNLIRLNSDGTPDASFVIGTGFNNTVRTVAVQADGKVLVGGIFTAYNGTAASNLIRLNPDGSPDAGFFTGAGFNNTVQTVVLQADGKVLVGGDFTTYQGATANRLARLNADGSRDAFGFNFNGTVWSIAVQANGQVLVGGQFTLCNFGCRYSLLRLNANGTEDGNFRIGGGFTLSANNAGTVRSVVVQPDGKVLVGGQFSAYNGAVANNLVRLNPDGTPDTGFATGTGFNGLVQSVALQADGQVLAGGAFTTYQGTAASRLARLTPSGALNSTPTAVSGATFTFAPGGSTTNPLVTGTAGSYTATASLNGETSAASNAVVLTPCATTLTRLTPASGPVGMSITLTGTALSGVTGVRFNGTVATTFAVVNATTVTATVPAGATSGPVTVTFPSGTSNGVTFTVTAPVITLDPSSLPPGRVGEQYPSLPLSATGGTSPYTFAVTSGTLPTGLTLSTGGLLSGTPTAGGPFPFTVTATDAAGFTGSQAYTMTPLLPSIQVVPALATGDVGVAYSQQLQALNGTAPYTFAVTSGALPAGITLTSGGLLAGTPTAGGTFNFTVTATDASTGTGPYTGSRAYSLGIAPARLTLSPGFLPNGTAGTAYSQTVTASGGISPYAYTVTSGTLPTGLTLTSGGVLSGTPTADGNFVFVITATDASTGFSPPRESRTYQVIIAPAPLDLVISTFGQSVAAGTYNSITVNNNGEGTLAGPVTVNSFVTVNNGGTLNTNCQALTGAGTFTLAAGGTLGICSPQGIAASGATGAVQTTGTRSFGPDASYTYNGTTAQVTGSGLPAQVRNIGTTNNSNVTLTAPLRFTRVLTVGAAGNLVTGGLALTLVSTATANGTGLVVNSGTGVVLGTVTVQRAIEADQNHGLGYRHYSSPISNATVADLATAGFAPVVNPQYNTSATPSLVRPFPTVYGYDQARLSVTSDYSPFDKGFFSPATLSDALVVGRGYAVNLDASQLVDFVGTLNNGDIALALPSNRATYPDGGWHLVGNPYPAPLNLAAVLAIDRPNLEAANYVFSSSSQYGGQYRSFVNNVGGNPVIPLGQGFFTRVVAGQTSGSLTFHNTQRLGSPTATTFERTTDPRPLVQLELHGATGPADVLYTYAENGATPGFDGEFDAVKLANSTGLNLSSAAATGEGLAIDGRPTFTASTVLPLQVGVPAAGPYTFTAAALNNLPAGLDALLTDAITGQTVNLRQQPSYAFSVSNAQAAALITGRFTLRFAARNGLATAPALTAAEVSLFPNPARDQFSVLVPAVAGATAVHATLLNALGQVVRQQTAPASAVGARLAFDTHGLATGVYALRLRVGAATLAKRVVIH